MSEKKNPLLEKVSIPGEKFRLPSGGIFYKDGELDESCTDGEVMIMPMNAVDELHLKSPDKLLSGDAIMDVFRRCLPDVTKPEGLLAKDVDYILMCLRLISYGPHFELTASHTCKGAKDHTYRIPLRPIIKKTVPINPTHIKNFKIKTEGGQTVQLHPPKFLATIKLYEQFGKEVESDEQFEEMGMQLINSVAEMINDVDGHEDQDDIKEWLKTVRVGDVRAVGDKVAELSDWGIDPVVEVDCEDCGKKMDVFVPVNPVSFFT